MIESYVKIDNATFQWDPEGSPCLNNISIHVKPRDHVMVVGSVGSGKSSFLQAILGEVPLVSGNVKVGGKLAYVPQTAWIFNGTVKDNILFGKPFDHNKYFISFCLLSLICADISQSSRRLLSPMISTSSLLEIKLKLVSAEQTSLAVSASV